VPIARRDQYTAGYFDALAEGRLAVLRCRKCQKWSPPGGFFSNPMIRCPGCGSADIGWELTQGTGRIVTWTHDPTFPSIVDGSPGQTSALVELAEGPWVFAALLIEPEQIVQGLLVFVEAVTPAAGGELVPAFRTADLPKGER
jgi:uncharacterized OB-fold protein